jgi:polar amino acid transport system substrate-binding protein
MAMQIQRSNRPARADLFATLTVVALSLAAVGAQAAETVPVPEAEIEATSLPVAPYQRVRSSGRIAFGYAVDGQPFSSRDAGGNPTGFTVGLCNQVALQLETDLGLSQLRVDWIPVAPGSRVDDVQRGQVDLLCTGEPVTLTARQSLSFSIAIFENGIGALMRRDGPESLRAALEERRPPYRPLWRGSTPQALERRVFTTVAGTPVVDWLSGRVRSFGLNSTVAPMDTYDAAVARVLARTADALFGDRARLLDAAQRSGAAARLIVLPRLYQHQPVALAMQRGDEDFRLAVDRALTAIFASPDFGALYAASFGEPEAETVAFYRVTALPE